MSMLFATLIAGVLPLVNVADGEPARTPTVESVYDFTLKDIDGKDVSLSKYKGDVLLIVNTASKCGLTPQYEALEALHKRYKDRGFSVLAFPANNFGNQEPGDNAAIKEFCSSEYHTTFPLFAKISVKGDDQHALFKFLANYPNKDIAGEVKWNFQKYLVGRDGKVLSKFDPRVKPDDKTIIDEIEKALAAKKP